MCDAGHWAHWSYHLLGTDWPSVPSCRGSAAPERFPGGAWTLARGGEGEHTGPPFRTFPGEPAELSAPSQKSPHCWGTNGPQPCPQQANAATPCSYSHSPSCPTTLPKPQGRAARPVCFPARELPQIMPGAGGQAGPPMDCSLQFPQAPAQPGRKVKARPLDSDLVRTPPGEKAEAPTGQGSPCPTSRPVNNHQGAGPLESPSLPTHASWGGPP